MPSWNWVARRAGVSKGVVAYHFAAKDDLIRAVIAEIPGSMAEHMEARLLAAGPLKFPEKFLAAYLTPELDLEAYDAGLVSLFGRATWPDPAEGFPAVSM
jgi:AcrR family transcriptional regulator